MAPDGPRKFLGVFGAEKKEERLLIAELQDIFKHAERLKLTIADYAAK